MSQIVLCRLAVGIQFSAKLVRLPPACLCCPHPRCKLVVMSATLQANTFVEYFAAANGVLHSFAVLGRFQRFSHADRTFLHIFFCIFCMFCADFAYFAQICNVQSLGSSAAKSEGSTNPSIPRAPSSRGVPSSLSHATQFHDVSQASPQDGDWLLFHFLAPQKEPKVTQVSEKVFTANERWNPARHRLNEGISRILSLYIVFFSPFIHCFTFSWMRFF